MRGSLWLKGALVWRMSVLATGLMFIQTAALAESSVGKSPKANKSGMTIETKAPSGAIAIKTTRIQGLDFYPEYPERLLDKGVIKSAWGTRFFAKEGAINWFHASIPLFVDSVNGNIELKSIYLLFFASNSTVEEVHVWDGATKIGSFTKLHLTGDYTSKVRAENSFVLPPGTHIRNSLAISVGVSFGIPDKNPQASGGLTLVSAGAAYR